MTVSHSPRGFDWSAARAKIQAASLTQRRPLEDVFSRRAAELARLPDAEVDRGTPHLAFEAAGNQFALSLDDVSVVLQADALHPVPFARNIVDRVLLVQGKFVSVYDLGVCATGQRTSGHVVIVLGDSARIGVRADAVRGLASVERAALIRPQGNGSRLDSILHGITTENVRVIDVARLLADGSR